MPLPNRTFDDHIVYIHSDKFQYSSLAARCAYYIGNQYSKDPYKPVLGPLHRQESWHERNSDKGFHLSEYLMDNPKELLLQRDDVKREMHQQTVV